MVKTGNLTVMKVSELIKALEHAQTSFGDVNVFFKGKIIIAERQDLIMKIVLETVPIKEDSNNPWSGRGK